MLYLNMPLKDFIREIKSNRRTRYRAYGQLIDCEGLNFAKEIPDTTTVKDALVWLKNHPTKARRVRRIAPRWALEILYVYRHKMSPNFRRAMIKVVQWDGLVHKGWGRRFMERYHGDLE